MITNLPRLILSACSFPSKTFLPEQLLRPEIPLFTWPNQEAEGNWTLQSCGNGAGHAFPCDKGRAEWFQCNHGRDLMGPADVDACDADEPTSRQNERRMPLGRLLVSQMAGRAGMPYCAAARLTMGIE